MADLVSYGNANRDIDQAIIALKEGAQLLKYGRKGKPKFCPFRLSTAVFQRYLRPERTIYHFLFHAITESGLLIWKVEAQVWIAGLKALISSGRGGRSKIDGWSDGGLYLDVLQDGKHLTSNSRSDSSASGARDSGSPDYEFKLKVFS